MVSNSNLVSVKLSCPEPPTAAEEVLVTPAKVTDEIGYVAPAAPMIGPQNGRNGFAPVVKEISDVHPVASPIALVGVTDAYKVVFCGNMVFEEGV